ncbi:response regulator receiver domain-containing protein [Archangium gephyra]|uniref:Response regulator receiver domain-containing protein n=2 Tax=Archangium gephyra TaxID=48 RepID=A0ABX9K3V5_9BACT|nr:response regulator [Archangium gephyra]REG32861.1 response regulator receiver domain-containing protein [Archangium gephyra]
MMERPLLLVEDSDPDAEALLRIARKLPLSAPVVRVADGESALDYLFQRGEYAQAPRPVLVLLDLNLPGIGGQEVLAQLKADPGLRSLPIIIFSNSSQAKDVSTAYAGGANSYLFKPSGAVELQEVARALECFWFSAALLPGLEEPTG